jgi:hypothetical protein
VSDEERSRFDPPTADPPRYGVAGLPEYAPAPPQVTPRRNYSSGDPGLAHQAVRTAPVHPAGAPADDANGFAVASLTLSIIGLGLLVITLGLLSPVALPCSLLGWIFGHKAKARPGEQGMAQGGFVTGIVGTVLGVVALLAWVALLA